MDTLSIILIVIGLIGSICSFSFALASFRHKLFSPKATKICLLIGIICTILSIVGFAIIPKNPSYSHNKNSATCPVCHKTFSYEDNEYGGYDYDNVQKIKYSNMCERCYDNYKIAQYAKDYID